MHHLQGFEGDLSCRKSACFYCVAAFHLHLSPKTLGWPAACSTHMLWAPQANTGWVNVCGAAQGKPLRQLYKALKTCVKACPVCGHLDHM